MKVGVCESTELKERSEALAVSFADLLWGYVVEDMMLRVSTSAYKEVLWLMTLPLLGIDAYRERAKKHIRFFYQESERALPPEKLRPGQKLSLAMGNHICKEVFDGENAQKIIWESSVSAIAGGVVLNLIANYQDMKVPLTLEIYSFGAVTQIPGKKEEELPAIGGKKITYLVYSPESELSYDLFAIMDKLELIASMGSYYDAYRLLKSQSLSGRYVLEELTLLAKSSPKIKKAQRLKQLEGYRTYAYMRKRWDKYLRNHGVKAVAWEEALDIILAFVGPIWKSLCRNEIFFDDWMPELGRSLG